MNENFTKSGILVNKKFREFFLPTVLASMAAISACMPLSQITYAMAVLVSIGSSGLIAIASGKRDNNEADYTFSTVILIGVFTATIWAVFLILNSFALPSFLSSAENLRGMVREYLTFFVWRLPLYLMCFSWETLIRTDGMAKIVSRGVLVGQTANVTLSFILVSSGFGITGASLALILSDVIEICYMLRKYFSSNERTRKFCFVLGDFNRFASHVAGVIKSGIPVAPV